MSTEKNPYQITILNAEASHPHLFQARDYKGDKNFRYTINLILNEAAHADKIKEIQDKIEALLKETRKKVNPNKWCFQKADPDEFGPGTWEFRAASSEDRRPAHQVLRRDKTPAVAKDNLFYGGAVVNAVVHIYEAFERVNGGLDIVQFVKDGTPRGRKPVSADEALPDLDDEDGLA